MKHTEAFEQALQLAITAPTDKQCNMAVALAENFAVQFALTKAQIKKCKAKVLRNLKTLNKVQS